MVNFHVFEGILVILCALGGGVGHFLKFRECFGHYFGFKGNQVISFFRAVHWSLFRYRVYVGHFLWLRGHCGHFFRFIGLFWYYSSNRGVFHLFQALGYFCHFLAFRRYSGHFLCFRGVSVIFYVPSVF